MKVYVLTRGIPYEGEDIVGVYSTSEKADEAADEAAAEGRADPEWAPYYWEVMEFEVQ